jgi:hypothetical protein
MKGIGEQNEMIKKDKIALVKMKMKSKRRNQKN